MTNTSIFTKAAAWVGCIVALLVGVAMLFGSLSSSSPSVGASYSAPHTEIYPWSFSAGLQIGNKAPVIKETAVGTCNLAEAGAAGAMTASSTMLFNCVVPSTVNVQVGDLIQVSLFNGHAAAWGGFVVLDAVASSTAAGNGGTITVSLLNDTGAATSSFPLATTSAQFEINRI